MKKQFLFPLALSLFLAPISVKASTSDTVEANSLESNPSEIILAGFLDSITDIKEGVESVKDGINTTNETTTDTIDAVHGINQGVGDSKKIVEGGGETQNSEVIEQTQIQETTESQEQEGVGF